MHGYVAYAERKKQLLANVGKETSRESVCMCEKMQAVQNEQGIAMPLQTPRERERGGILQIV